MKKDMLIPIGVFAFVLFIVLKRFTEAHESIMGLLLGISICANLMGLLPDYLHERLRRNKLHFIRNRSKESKSI